MYSSQILSFLFISFVQRALSIRMFFDVDIFETLASRQKIKLTLDPRRKKLSYKQEAEKVLPLVSIYTSGSSRSPTK